MERKKIYKGLIIPLIILGIMGIASNIVDASEDTKVSQSSEILNINNSINLLDVKWEAESTCGSGDLSVSPATVTINSEDISFERALQAHAPSKVIYDIGDYSNEYDTFISYAGINKDGKGDVKFKVSTSADGKNWVTAFESSEIVTNNFVIPIDINIEGKEYLSLEAENLGNNGGNYAVYLQPQLIKSSSRKLPLEDTSFYEKQLKKVSSADAIDKDSNLLIKKKFVEVVGYEKLKFFFDTADDNNISILENIINDDKLMKEFVTSKKLGTGSYFDALKILIDLYQEHSADLADSKNGDLFRRMMTADSFVYSSWDGYSSPWTARANFITNPVTRYEKFKKLYLTNKFDNNVQFSKLSVELLAWIFDAPMDDNEIEWLNDYARSAVNKDKGKDYALGIYQIMNWVSIFDFTNPDFYDLSKAEQWDKKYNLKKYSIEYGVEDHAKIWMGLEQGGACGLMAGVGVSLAAVFGIPSHVIHQPIHAPFVMYRPINDNLSEWAVEASVASYLETNTDLNTLQLGWENKPWVNGSYDENYLYIMQAALDDKENYDKANLFLELAKMYQVGSEEYENILEKALDVQKINLDVFDSLMDSYIKNGKHTDEDYLKLAVLMQHNLKYYPSTLVDALQYIAKQLKKDENQIVIQILLENGLKDALNATKDDVPQSEVTNTIAKEWLAKNDTSVATFSFDGEYKNIIILSDKYKNMNFQLKYSIDGGENWKQTSEHKIKLSEEELKALNSQKDILITFVGSSEDYTIELNKEDVDFDEAKIKVNDQENRLVGDPELLNKIEYSIDDGKSWSALDPSEEGTLFAGDVTVVVRKRNNAQNLVEGTPIKKKYHFTKDKIETKYTYIPSKNVSTKEVSSGDTIKENINDGNPDTWWGTEGEKDMYATIELKDAKYLSKLKVMYRTNGDTKGEPSALKIYTSLDGEHWTETANAKNWDTSLSVNNITFTPTLAKYVKLIPEKTLGDAYFVLGEVNLYEDIEETKKAPQTKFKNVEIYQGDTIDFGDFIESIDGKKEYSNYQLDWLSEVDTGSKASEYQPKIKITNGQGYAAIVEPQLTIKGNNSINLLNPLGEIAATIFLDKKSMSFHVSSSDLSAIFDEASQGKFVELTLYDSEYKEKRTITVNGTANPNELKKSLETINYKDGDYLLIKTAKEKSLDAYGNKKCILQRDEATTEEQFEIKDGCFVKTNDLVPIVTTKEVTIPLGQAIKPEDFITMIDHSTNFTGKKIEMTSTPDLFNSGEKEVSLKVTNKFNHSVNVMSKLKIIDTPTITMLAYATEERLKFTLEESKHQLNVIQDTRGTVLDSGDTDYGTITLLDKELKVKSSVTAKTTDKPDVFVNSLNGLTYEDGDYLEYKIHNTQKLRVVDTTDELLKETDAKNSELIQIKDGKFIYINNYTPKMKLVDRTIALGEDVKATDFVQSIDTIGNDNKVEFVKEPNPMVTGKQEVIVRVTNVLGQTDEETATLTVNPNNALSLLGSFGNELMNLVVDKSSKILKSCIADNVQTYTIRYVGLFDKDFTEKKSITAGQLDFTEKTANAMDGVPYENGDYLKIQTTWDNNMVAYTNNVASLSKEDAKNTEVFEIKEDALVRVTNFDSKIITKEKNITAGEVVKPESFIDTVDGVKEGKNVKLEFVNNPDTTVVGSTEVELKVTNKFGTVSIVKAPLTIDAIQNAITILGYADQERLMVIPNDNHTLSVTQDTRGTILESNTGDFATMTLYGNSLVKKQGVTVKVTDKPDVVIDALNGKSYEDGDFLEFKMYKPHKLTTVTAGQVSLKKEDAEQEQWFQIEKGKFIPVNAKLQPKMNMDSTVAYTVGDKLSLKQLLKDVHYAPQSGMAISADLDENLSNKAGKYTIRLVSENPASNEKAVKEIVLLVNEQEPLETVGATITQLTYQMGENMITGNYTGDVKNARLYINGKSVSWGGTFQNDKFSYLVDSKIIKKTDKITVTLYGSGVKKLSSNNSVTIQ